MIKKVRTIIAMAAALCAFTSCLSSNDDDITYYDDTAITSFSLGTVKRYVTTTASDGTDSVYTTTYSGSSYHFYIDQVNAVIYNPDSLPLNTDAKHIVCTIGTKNSGVAVLVLKSQTGTDSLAYYSSSDSIDFTEPLTVRVYNIRGTAYRNYTIKVNVHQEDGNAFSWHANSATQSLAQMAGRRFASLGDSHFLFGNVNGATVGYTLNGSSWQPLTMATTLSADAYKSMTVKGDSLYTLSNGTLLTSTDGASWTAVAQTPQLKQLLGASPFRLYALGDDALYVSKDNGATWSQESLDDEASLLPTEDMSLVVRPHLINDSTYRIQLVGIRNGETSVWSKVEEDADNSESQPWAYYTSSDVNHHTLPALDNLQVIEYDGALLALGGDFSTFYRSDDDGLTWFAESTYAFPAGFGLQAAPFAMARDNNNYIFLSKASSSIVWSGRLARLGWATEQTAFTE
jgi:hypothetical protein